MLHYPVQWLGFLQLLEGKQSDYVSNGRCSWQIGFDILTCYAADAHEKGSLPFVHCMGALLKFVKSTICWMHASLWLLWWCWKHHLVKHRFFTILKFLYDNRSISIMLRLCYSSVRCLHGENSCTTDSTGVGVTLDFVVISNHSLTRTIAPCLYVITML